MNHASLFELKDISYTYSGKTTPALRDVSCAIHEGEFIVLLGHSGSGKSTLGRVLSGLVPEFYGGRLEGKITFHGVPIGPHGKCRREIGLLFQNPEQQLLSLEVRRELVCGMEFLGLAPSEMKRRLSEISAFLNLGPLLDRETRTLSGGEKQRVVLGSILAMGPRVLILDEPTSQLDPVTAVEVLELVRRFVRDLGYTVILMEQRPDRSLHLADRVLFLDGGRLIHDVPVQEFADSVEGVEDFLPQVTQVFKPSLSEGLPLTIGAGRKILPQPFEADFGRSASFAERPDSRASLVTFQNVSFGYQAAVPVFQDLNLNIKAGSLVAILGENGAGKSTLLRLMGGILKPGRGAVRMAGKSGYLSQEPSRFWFHDSAEEELAYSIRNFGLKDHVDMHGLLKQFRIEAHAKTNPRDLSVGESQRVALAGALVREPEILLLDEPTRGLELASRRELGLILKRYISDGRRAVVLVTQDMEFAAEFATNTLIFSKGELTAEGLAREVMDGNIFFSPQVNQLFRGWRSQTMTIEEGRRLVRNREESSIFR